MTVVLTPNDIFYCLFVLGVVGVVGYQIGKLYTMHGRTKGFYDFHKEREAAVSVLQAEDEARRAQLDKLTNLASDAQTVLRWMKENERKIRAFMAHANIPAAEHPENQSKKN